MTQIKLDNITKAWLYMIALCLIGHVIALLVAIWWDKDLAMRIWLSTMAITLMPIWLLTPFA